MMAGADLSIDEVYRYRLWRTWDDSLPILVWVMLNPSTADHSKDDPTITRCINFAKAFGYGGIIVVNMFAYRSTYPKDLRSAAEPVGLDNDAEIASVILGKDVIAAWGGGGDDHKKRVAEVISILREPMAREACYCLGRTETDQPRHPLMLRKDTKLEAYDGR